MTIARSVKLYLKIGNMINCLLNGSSEWMVISKEDSYLVPVSDTIEEDGSQQSTLHVDKVDLPKLEKYSYQFSYTLKPGDCIYIPYGKFHIVNLHIYLIEN